MLRFLVLANPRSRTRWLAEYLQCGHDLALGCRSVDEFEARLRDSVGSVETSVALGWPLWRELFPAVRFAIVHRVPTEVAESFTRLGLEPDWMFLYQQDRALWNCVENDPGERTVLWSFESLASPTVRGELCSWLEIPWDEERDERLAERRIVVDWAERAKQVVANQANTLAFYNDMGRRLATLTYGPQV